MMVTFFDIYIYDLLSAKFICIIHGHCLSETEEALNEGDFLLAAWGVDTTGLRHARGDCHDSSHCSNCTPQ